MFTRGEYSVDEVTYGVMMSHTKACTEAILIMSGTIVSAYKIDKTGSYSYNNNRAKDFVKLIQTGVKGCTSKNGVAAPFVLGALIQHEFKKGGVQYSMQMYRSEVVGAFIQADKKSVSIEYAPSIAIPDNIPYVRLTEVSKEVNAAEDDLDAVQVRSVEEIALEKEDTSWLQTKKYYVVKDDETAEKLFQYFDSYNGAIAYDTETTGLKINCFSKIGSSYQKSLEAYNAEHPDDKVRSDRLVGIIFCVEDNVSYYFPCFNRKFKNLYQDLDSPVRKKIIANIRARYTIGDRHNPESDMYKYIMATKDEDLRLDVILMERVRDILTKKHLVAHNGAFEWKVGWCYEIVTNVADDTMIMHQLMYKFRSTTRNSGEPSNLKYLAKRELGIDQWELGDFFPNYKEDKKGTVRERTGAKKNARIDFSYMDEAGTRVYAPTDGDVTLLLWKRYKPDLVENHQEMIYIYQVELIVAQAVAYMEFYGHRIDEAKIFGAREETRAKMAMLESEIRQKVGYADEAEIAAYTYLKELRESANTEKDKEKKAEILEKTGEAIDKLKEAIAANTTHVLNLAAPGQVADLFFNKLGYPLQGDKPSVNKKVVKALTKELNEDKTPKYPVAAMYSEYKNQDTLMTKFFDNLPYFMYPGGYIFSSYGQIATATGRMSCKGPNAQQYPKVITKIVIPRPGYVMIDADYSQIEYRVLTALAKNEWLAQLFSDPDSDYHTLMASLMYEVDYAAVTPSMRSAAKSFNFGIPYGMGLGSLAQLLTGKNTPQTRDEAAEKMEAYYKNQPKTRQFFIDVKEMASVNRYTKTLFNRYRYYSFEDKDGTPNNAKRAAALRQAGNAVIQGCVGGNTTIVTKEYGNVKIKDVVGQRLTVWDGYGWSLGDICDSGKKQKCIITLKNGKQTICSPIHKFRLATSGEFVECQELKAGDIIDAEKSIPIKRLRKSLDIKSTNADAGYTVVSVEITDSYIQMYDVCNTDKGIYVADGMITHNTAADIFKLSVARNFTWIKNSGLLGKVLIVNMVHDEQLVEADAQSLNIQRVLADMGVNMQFKLQGFPPLYIGAGVGKAWGYAKGKMAEIHPVLLQQFTEEAKSIPLFREDRSTPVDTNEVLEYFNKRVYEFRRKKVADYLSDPKNWYKDMHPAIGGLINLQFNYGRGDDAKAYTGPNGEKYSDKEFLELNLLDFIKENGLSVTPDMFKAPIIEKEVEKDNEYDDEDDEDAEDMAFEGDESASIFTMVNESDKTFGASLHDMISTFNTVVLEKQKVVGIKTKDMYFRKKDALLDFLNPYIIASDNANGKGVDDPSSIDGACQIVFLTDSNTLTYTGVYVVGLTHDMLANAYKAIMKGKGVPAESDFTVGDVKTRSQAK